MTGTVSPTLASIAIALLVWAPNLAWQAANDWPQLEMGQLIGRRALLERDTFVLEAVLLSGSLMTIVSIVGLGWLLLVPSGVGGGRSAGPPS